MEYSNLFVCAMGLGVVFAGLIVLIILVTVMSRVMRCFEAKPVKSAENRALAPAAAENGRVTPEVIAAISAAVAEEMGTNVSAIRIVSCKKV